MARTTLEPNNTELLKQLASRLEQIESRLSSKVDAPLDNHNKAVTADEGANKSGNNQTITTLPVSLHPAIEAHYQAEQHDRPSNDFWEKVKRGFEFAGIAIAIWLAFLTYSSLQETRTQANIMQRQLEATDRPWLQITSIKPIGIEGGKFSGLQFNKFSPATATFGITVKTKNVGHSVATNLSLRGLMTLASSDDELRTQQEQVCSGKIQSQFHPSLETAFPEDKDRDNFFAGILAFPKDAKTISPKIIGCVDYRIPSNPDHPHHTGFILNIKQIPEGSTYPFEPNPVKPSPVFVVGSNVSAARITLDGDTSVDIN